MNNFQNNLEEAKARVQSLRAQMTTLTAEYKEQIANEDFGKASSTYASMYDLAGVIQCANDRLWFAQVDAK